jgi:uncharacterized protein (TIGR03382 family)
MPIRLAILALIVLTSAFAARAEELASVDRSAEISDADLDAICKMGEAELVEAGLSPDLAAQATAGECWCPHDPKTEQIVNDDGCRNCGNLLTCAQQRCSIQPAGGGPVETKQCAVRGGGCSQTGDQSSLLAFVAVLGLALARRRR